jgi:hypothetical protein
MARLALLIVFLVVCVNCSEGPSTDSETHWIVRPPLGLCEVNEECEAGYDCLCGFCTIRCVGHQDCGGIEGAVCVEQFEQEHPSCPTSVEVQSPALCMIPCSQDSTCGDRSQGLNCNHGHCSPPVRGREEEGPVVDDRLPAAPTGPEEGEPVPVDDPVTHPRQSCEGDDECLILQNPCSCVCELSRDRTTSRPQDVQLACTGRGPTETCNESCDGWIAECVENLCVMRAAQ